MDTLTKKQRGERMSRIKSKNTKPELRVRRIVHGLGYRYRLHDKSLPGTPDLVFKQRKKAIFVHGCFWHRHKNCHLARLPKSKLDFWLPKLEGNRQRDEKNLKALDNLGWEIMVIWECELIYVEKLTNRLTYFLGSTRAVEC